ncbi:hypothetical protein OJF2_37680 [Aquisphaera giovannonii]|uniref:Uncharacterized protein n=1 Tax=Aquisphaera giovannonii TaxID=406548 RepID=A0A5B9W5A7_9BACT|nr:hypothetical protein OJF2_37680 [Aquisphaera giovannonii]
MNASALPQKLLQHFGTATIDETETGEIEAGKWALLGLDANASHFIDPSFEQLAFELDDAARRNSFGNRNSQHR